ncbi:MAG: glycosyltransferase [Polynucleobacter sp.]
MTIPKKWAPLLSRWHDALFCSRTLVARQGRRTAKAAASPQAISVAIAHYNRGYTAHRPLCNLLDNPLVGEVVFFDDGSSSPEFAALVENVRSLDPGGKVRIERRESNKGAQRTKIDAVAACRNEWVLVLDSDNTAFCGYLRQLAKIQRKDPDTIYCSPFAFPYFSFKALAGRSLSFDQCCKLTRSGLLRQCYIINDGNYLVHRDRYLLRTKSLQDLPSDVADVMLANYLWLSEGGSLEVLPRGAYHHRIDASSFWVRTAEESRTRVRFLFELLEEGCRWKNLEDFLVCEKSHAGQKRL